MEENFSSRLNLDVDGIVKAFHEAVLGNTLKYLLRHQNEVEDLKKARKNLDWLIDLAEEMRE